jgi:methylthioribose-1-phosphate isomerase
MKTLIAPTPTIEWTNGHVKFIDQTKLPLLEEYINTDDYRVVCDAIYRLAIRGAPAIGVAGAYACVLAANEIQTTELNDFIKQYLLKADKIGSTRPTAVNLMWAVKQMKDQAIGFSGNVAELKIALLDLAHEIRDDDLDRCHNLGLHGAHLIPNKSNVMTICNTGGLATSGIGTALELSGIRSAPCKPRLWQRSISSSLISWAKSNKAIFRSATFPEKPIA